MNNQEFYNQFMGDFIDRLMEAKGLADESDPEMTAKIKADLEEMLNRKIDAVILENMPEDKLEEFEKIIDEDDAEKLKNFVSQNIPNLDEVITTCLWEFRNAYL
jgi:nicotinate-nucleotide pyrophosphorylase